MDIFVLMARWRLKWILNVIQTKAKNKIKIQIADDKYLQYLKIKFIFAKKEKIVY